MIDVQRFALADRRRANDSEPAAYASNIVGTASTARYKLRITVEKLVYSRMRMDLSSFRDAGTYCISQAS
jgi:hypothetical protein